MPLSTFLVDLLTERKAAAKGSLYVFPGPGKDGHPEGILSVEKSIEIIDLVEGQIARIDAVPVARLSQDQRSDVDVRDIVQQVGDEFRNWIMENKPEIVDVVMRLTPASAFIGLLSSEGANMAWATPIVLAMWGGKSVVGALKNIKS